MRTIHFIPLSAVLAALFAAPSFAQTTLHLDRPRPIAGVESACAGVGYSSENNPQWNAYPLKIVLDGKGGQYLADGNVSLVRGGKTIASVQCDGPWVLFKPTPGTYRIVGGIGTTTETAVADVKAGSQDLVILNFPHMGGTVTR